MQQTEIQFLNDLDKRLWTAADKLRSNLDAAVYKHVVLGLIFLKYVSDAFNERREELVDQFRDRTTTTISAMMRANRRRAGSARLLH